MTRLLQIACMIYFATMLTACSLLSFELKSDAIPLSQQQHQLRMKAREFGEIFFTAVEKTANEIQGSKTKNIYKENAILWKINAEAAAIDAIYKNQPIIAFIDIWAFAVQMTALFESPAGKKLFGDNITKVLAVSKKMQSDIEGMGKNQFSSKEYEEIQKFIESYRKKYPITDLTFQRYPIYTIWIAKVDAENAETKKANKGKKSDEKKETQSTTVGTLPEVMSDMSDRVATISRQMQKNIIWQTELLALNGDIDVKLLGKTVDNAYQSSIELHNILLNKDQSMDILATSLTSKLYPVVDALDTTAGKYMNLLNTESLRFTTALANQREAIDIMIARERASILASVETMRESTIKQVMQEVTTMIGNVLWLLIVLFAVILFVPFGAGVFFGRLWKK